MITTISHGVVYSPEIQAIVNFNATPDQFKPGATLVRIDKDIVVAPWGEENNLPQLVLDKAEVNDIVSSNLLFNVQSAYGQGIKPMIRNADGSLSECVDEDILMFFEDNDITGYFLEQVSDMVTFFNVFPEIMLSGDGRQIVSLRSLEAAFSRWGSMGRGEFEISKHHYSALWGSDKKPTKDDVVTSPVLSRYHTFDDLAEKVKSGHRRFVLQVSMPTPGRTYYSNAYWHSIFKSGWYDLSVLIPKNKLAIMKNNLTIRNIVYISDKYWSMLLKKRGVSESDREAVEKLQVEEISNIKAFIENRDSKGGTLITSKATYASETGKAIEDKMIVIEPIDVKLTGGELVADSEEANSVISYAMGVHQSLNGASPGKTNGSLGGSDKETLFNMKQSMMRCFRDRLLMPLNLIKRYNGWRSDLVFIIPEYVLQGAAPGPAKQDDTPKNEPKTK